MRSPATGRRALPPTPASASRRSQRLRAVQAQADRPRLACILSGEAAAQRYAPPEQFDAAPPGLSVGEAIDVEAFAQELEQIGYIADDRVDEPGEVAIRGDVIDIFPADAGGPVRIEIADGTIAAIRSYDPASQRTTEERERIEVGRAADPQPLDAVPILAHLTPGLIGVSGQADARRKRFLALARDAAGRRGATLDAIDEDAWAAARKGWQPRDFDAGEPVPRFVERSAPLAAMARFARPLIAGGRTFVLAGSARDIRFLRPRVAKRLGIELAQIARWAEVATVEAVVLDMPVDRGFIDDRYLLVAAGDLLGSRAILGTAMSGLSDPLALMRQRHPHRRRRRPRGPWRRRRRGAGARTRRRMPAR